MSGKKSKPVVCETGVVMRTITQDEIKAKARNSPSRLFALIHEAWDHLLSEMENDNIGVGQFEEILFPADFVEKYGFGDTEKLSAATRVKRPISRFIEGHPVYSKRYIVKANKLRDGSVVVNVGIEAEG